MDGLGCAGSPGSVSIARSIHVVIAAGNVLGRLFGLAVSTRLDGYAERIGTQSRSGSGWFQEKGRSNIDHAVIIVLQHLVARPYMHQPWSCTASSLL